MRKKISLAMREWKICRIRRSCLREHLRTLLNTLDRMKAIHYLAEKDAPVPDVMIDMVEEIERTKEDIVEAWLPKYRPISIFKKYLSSKE